MSVLEGTSQVGRSFIEEYVIQPHSQDDEDDWLNANFSDPPDDDDEEEEEEPDPENLENNSTDNEHLPELDDEDDVGLLEATKLHQVGYFDPNGLPYGHVYTRESVITKITNNNNEDDEILTADTTDDESFIRLQYELQSEYKIDSDADADDEDAEANESPFLSVMDAYHAYTMKKRVEEANQKWGTGDEDDGEIIIGEESSGLNTKRYPRVQFNQTVELYTVESPSDDEGDGIGRVKIPVVKSTCELRLGHEDASFLQDEVPPLPLASGFLEVRHPEVVQELPPLPLPISHDPLISTDPATTFIISKAEPESAVLNADKLLVDWRVAGAVAGEVPASLAEQQFQEIQLSPPAEVQQDHQQPLNPSSSYPSGFEELEKLQAELFKLELSKLSVAATVAAPKATLRTTTPKQLTKEEPGAGGIGKNKSLNRIRLHHRAPTPHHQFQEHHHNGRPRPATQPFSTIIAATPTRTLSDDDQQQLLKPQRFPSVEIPKLRLIKNALLQPKPAGMLSASLERMTSRNKKVLKVSSNDLSRKTSASQLETLPMSPILRSILEPQSLLAMSKSTGPCPTKLMYRELRSQIVRNKVQRSSLQNHMSKKMMSYMFDSSTSSNNSTLTASSSSTDFQRGTVSSNSKIKLNISRGASSSSPVGSSKWASKPEFRSKSATATTTTTTGAGLPKTSKTSNNSARASTAGGAASSISTRQVNNVTATAAHPTKRNKQQGKDKIDAKRKSKVETGFQTLSLRKDCLSIPSSIVYSVSSQPPVQFPRNKSPAGAKASSAPTNSTNLYHLSSLHQPTAKSFNHRIKTL